jgi:hypothetical protein
MSLTYGYDLKSNDDPMIAAPVEASEMISELILPGAVLVNHLPFCADTRSITSYASALPIMSTVRHIPSWVPWFNYESLAQKGRELSSRVMNEPFDFVKNAMVRNQRSS